MAKFENQIRGYNRKLDNLAKNFGTDSTIYQLEQAKVEKIIPQENLRYNDKGVLQIAKPKDLESKGYTGQVLDRNLDIRGTAQVEKEYKSRYEQYKQDVEHPLSKKDFIESIEQVYDVFASHFDSNEIKKILKRIEEENRDGEEVDKEIISKGMQALDNFMNQRMNNKKVTYEDFVNLAKVVDMYGI